MAKELDMVGRNNGQLLANAKPKSSKELDKQADYQAKYDATVVQLMR